MEWALEDRPGVDDLVEYETRLNYVLPRYRTRSYDCTISPSLAGRIVVDIMRTHPMIIIGGILRRTRSSFPG